MSKQQRALALRFFEEADRGRTPHGLLAPGFAAHFNGVPPMDAIAYDGFEAMVRAGFSNIHHHIQDVVAEGDDVAVRLTFEATHKGEFMGVHPADTRVAVDGTAFLRLEDGRVAALWGFLDMLALLQQIGGLPTPAAEV